MLKETLEFDPEILKRYVNFMNNPDEKSAVEQFGKGDKYIGVATLLATLPGLPMFGHGQFEGFAEKYGMEFRRATMDEQPDQWLIERHEREIVPLLHRRGDFAEARDFLLYDFGSDGGGVDEHVFAYSNGTGPSRSLVVYHNRYAESSGWIRDSVGFALKAADGSKSMVRRTLADGLGLADGPADGRWLAMREQRSGLEYLRSVAEIRERGVHVSLHAYETRVFWELRELYDAAGVWGRLAERLGGRGVPSLEGALRELQLAPVHDALRAAIAAPPDLAVERLVAVVAEATGTSGDRAAVVGAVLALVSAAEPVATTIDDPSQAAALRVWALLRPLGSLPAGAHAGADEPGVVRGAASGDRPWSTRCGATASTRRAPGGRPSACGCCSTCRCPRPSAGAPRDCRSGSSTRGWPTRSFARSCGSTAGTTRSGSTANRGWSSSPGPIASSAC